MIAHDNSTKLEARSDILPMLETVDQSEDKLETCEHVTEALSILYKCNYRVMDMRKITI